MASTSLTQQNLCLPTGLSQLPSITKVIRERAVVKFDETLRESPAMEEDEDEYTLSGYGDISMSNDSFLPGMLGELTPISKKKKSTRRMDASPLKAVNYNVPPAQSQSPLKVVNQNGRPLPKRKGSGSSPLKLGQSGRRSPPPSMNTVFFDDPVHPLPPLLRKILPASPTKVKQKKEALEEMLRYEY